MSLYTLVRAAATHPRASRASAGGNFKAEIDDFVRSEDRVRLLGDLPRKGARVVVLDSSFNPPHYAHLELASLGMTNTRDNCILLLLSITNADKKPAPAAFEQRLEMMELFKNSIDAEVVLGLTKEPYFVDKYKVIKRLLGTHNLNPHLHFPMGLDTLVRLVDQKYYKEPVSEALKDFFNDCHVHVLTRDDILFKLEELPEQWQRHIHMSKHSSKTDGVSSSNVRALVKSHKRHQDFERLVPPQILAYIVEHGLYK
ncbi:putative nicotinamide mononucleotide adenylyltransferase [Yarrowia sp. C11]|nr:putative nicotinamide mononucleotide adenylyltransferase [Yarrowia sp. E02]KAG5369881.1 putative nicotinamide mononucleotide adenylyltransferase [Yarrowia sp. C11]